MFKNIYYDRRNNKIHLWEIEDGKSRKIEEKYLHEYYVEDRSGTGQYKDVHGNIYNKQTTYDKWGMKSIVESGIKCCETDLSEDIKYLHKRYEGHNYKPDVDQFRIAYLDIEVAVESEFPKPTEVKYPINAITVIDSFTEKPITFGNRPFTKQDSNLIGEYHYVPDEFMLLAKFVQWFRKQKYDIITGWNLDGFDIPYIINRIRMLSDSGLEYKLSPINKIDYYERNEEYTIAGITTLDYMKIYKNFTFDTLPSYSLNFVALKEIKEGKLDFEGQLNTIYKDDWNTFIEYNIQDVLLILKLEKKKKFISLAINLSYEALIPLSKVYSSVSVIEGFILREHRKDNVVMINRSIPKYDWWLDDRHYISKEINILNGEMETVYQNCDSAIAFSPFQVKGGHVNAKPGYYEHNISFDVESEYPHMIMLYNISPETKVILPSEEQIKNEKLIQSVINGVYYRRDIEGFLPKIVKKIFDERKRFKDMMFEAEAKGDEILRQYYHSMQMIRKIIINSIYGVLLEKKSFHYYDPDNARAVTRGGRCLIRHLSDSVNLYFKNYWHKIAHKYFPVDKVEPLKKEIKVLVDTDSNYLNLDEIKKKCAPDMKFIDFAYIMENQVIQPFFDRVLDIYVSKIDRPQIINFKREGIISQQFILAKKKYITRLLVNEKTVYDTPKLKITGVEVVRSDTPKFCQEKIKMVINYILDNLNRDDTINILREIKKEFDVESIGNIAKVKGIKEYTKYAKPIDYYLKHGLIYQKGLIQHAKASICYNYMIKRNKLPYLEIDNGTKIKYIYVNPRNILKTNVIGFIGNYPTEFKNVFEVDHDTQYSVTFLNIIQRMFNVLNWGKINLIGSKINKFLKTRSV